jgi:hypothetical protein
MLNFVLLILYIRERRRRKKIDEINVVLKEYYEEALSVIEDTRDFNYKIKINQIKNKLHYYEREIEKIKNNMG